MAEHLAAQAFPATDIFDSWLIRHVNEQKHTGLRMRSFDLPLFVQVGKITPFGFAGGLGSLRRTD